MVESIARPSFVRYGKVRDKSRHWRMRPLFKSEHVVLKESVQVAQLLKMDPTIFSRTYEREGYRYRQSVLTPIFPFHNEDEVRPFLSAFSQRMSLRFKSWERAGWVSAALCMDNGGVCRIKEGGELLGNFPFYMIWAILSGRTDFKNIPFSRRSVNALNDIYKVIKGLFWLEDGETPRDPMLFFERELVEIFDLREGAYVKPAQDLSVKKLSALYTMKDLLQETIRDLRNPVILKPR
jgi:hypothetical protein